MERPQHGSGIKVVIGNYRDTEGRVAGGYRIRQRCDEHSGLAFPVETLSESGAGLTAITTNTTARTLLNVFASKATSKAIFLLMHACVKHDFYSTKKMPVNFFVRRDFFIAAIQSDWLLCPIARF